MHALAISVQQKAGPAAQQVGVALIVMLVVLAASLFGILTRPMGFLAAIWPANAILLGLMVRNPAFSNVWGWLGAFLGYMAADLFTGGEITITFWLTMANMSGVLTGLMLFMLVEESDRRLGRPLSVLYLFAICSASAAVAAVIGGGAATIVFERDFFSGLEFWFVTELVNSLVILPTILTFRYQNNAFQALSDSLSKAKSYWTYAPIFALVISAGAAIIAGGPGSIAYPVPALLWCALSYRMFTVAVIAGCVCGLLLITVTTDFVHSYLFEDVLASTSSMRLGISLIALAPLTAASINEARMELLRQLKHSADHDPLTGILNRRAFMERATAMAGSDDHAARAVTVLMLDIDHFKAVNDTHGHVVGDKVLVDFTRTLTSCLRPTDIFARIGGEEFAVVVPGSSRQTAELVAERIRLAISSSEQADDNALPQITTSIGVALSSDHPDAHFDTLLSNADAALYRAKSEGRNRSVFA